MFRSYLLFAAFLLLPASPVAAQHGAATDAGTAAAPAEARQFDFLLGQWEIELTPKTNSLVAMIHGRPHLVGMWKAWPAFDGMGIEDELRITDGSGNPVMLIHSLRIFDAQNRRWAINALDVHRAHFHSAVGILQGDTMFVGGSGTNGEGKAYRSRTRFHATGEDDFEMRQDRSFDKGASWDADAIVVVAHRVARSAER